MVLRKIITTISLLAFITLSSGISASPYSTASNYGKCSSGTNCGDQRTKNTAIGVLLVAGLVIYVVRNNKNNGSNLVSDNSLANGYGFKLAGKDRNSRDSNYRLSNYRINAFSFNNNTSFSKKEFIENEDKVYSINLIQVQF
tara:strand:+ start:121 stop:546 length:426 start_codon:yes stop_codon:yes gene_type:complete